MVLSFLGGPGKPPSVEELILRRKYGRALELLREQLAAGGRDGRLRLQLADVLILSGRGKEAVSILIELADENARDGFAAKAIALLKKIERLEPGRADVDRRLASLINKERSRPSPTTASSRVGVASVWSPPTPDRPPIEIGIEEIRPIAEPVEGPGPAEDMSAEDFDLELVEVAQEALKPGPTGGAPAPVVASPLFSDFGEEELLAVMRGLELRSFEPGDIVLTEGEPGDSLFVLATGAVKAFVRDPAGRHVQVRTLTEGSFFGEISILSGGPRTATVTAATRCELLVLDRRTLDAIASAHPGVRRTLEAFSTQRAGSPDERRVRQPGDRPGGS